MAKQSKQPKTTNGWYRACVGLEKRLDGALVPARFYTAKDLTDHEAKKKAIQARWLELKATGVQFWSGGELKRLEDQGLIRSRPTDVDKALATKLLSDVHIEPLNADEMKPFVGDDGAVRPDAAPQAADFITRKVFSRLDVRSALFNSLYAEALRDPIGTFERCSRLFGWTGAQTTAFLFPSGGGVAVSPIAFDASENAGRNVLDLIDAKVVDKGTGGDVDGGD